MVYDLTSRGGGADPPPLCALLGLRQGHSLTGLPMHSTLTHGLNLVASFSPPLCIQVIMCMMCGFSL